jgi:hypothetical protein
MTDELKALKPYWLSWIAETEEFVLYFPWWISGYIFGGDEDESTICAAVWARSEEDAKDIIKNSHFKESDGASIEFRFCETRPFDWSPFCGRFPRADWMIWWDDGVPLIETAAYIRGLRRAVEIVEAAQKRQDPFTNHHRLGMAYIIDAINYQIDHPEVELTKVAQS